MSKFYNAMTTNDAYTENGDVTNSTSGTALLDWFFQLGAMRKTNENEILRMFTNAFAEAPLDALRALFYARDIRGGQGERRLFRICLKWLVVNYPDVVYNNLHLVPEYGRWDDLFVLFDTDLEPHMAEFILANIYNGNQLAAKWMPREKSAQRDKAFLLAQYWGLSMRDYRKLLAGNTSVVEQQMSANRWAEINYAHVPSKAMLKYRKAFPKHDPEGWLEYLESLSKGETKVNANTLYPSDIVGKIRQGSDEQILDHQWNALPNWVEANDFIPVCDVSGSMSGDPMNVSIGLGLYLSERANDAFKDLIITFSGKPQLHRVRGNNIRERVQNLSRADWGMNTNLRAVFGLILRQGQRFNLSQADMPKNVLIISDMQFDSCVTGFSTFDDINRMYAQSGYTRPNLVFWNVRASDNKAFPVKFDERGVALVSGYSPSIIKHVLTGEMNPVNVMRNVLDSDRYRLVQL